MSEISESLKWVSLLSQHKSFPTKNFMKSLEYPENGMKFNELLNKMESNGIKFSILKGFKFDSLVEEEKTYKQIKIKIKISEDDEFEISSILEFIEAENFKPKLEKEVNIIINIK